MFYFKLLIFSIVILYVLIEIDLRIWHMYYWCKSCDKQVFPHHVTHCPHCGATHPYQENKSRKLVGWFKNEHFVFGDKKL